ncbi:MAG: gamma-glutamyltransferase [Hyphomicrobiales bacterium]
MAGRSGGPARRLSTVLDPARPRATRGTTHVSVVDGAGNAAAVTVTNGEGNGALVAGAGYMLNNMLGEEDLNPGGFHRWQPGIRLASMMAPTIACDRDGGVLVLGSGGSNRIRTAVLQAIVARLQRGLDLETAITAPRLHLERGHLDFETLAGEEVATALAAAWPDHRAWPEPNMFFGGVHAAERTAAGAFAAVGDPRRAGVGILV